MATWPLWKKIAVGVLLGSLVLFFGAIAIAVIARIGLAGVSLPNLGANWLWGALLFPAFQWGVGIYQQRKNYSYSADAVYYLFGGGGLILGLLTIVFGVDLVQSMIVQSRSGSQVWAQEHVDTGNAINSIYETVDWWKVFGVFALVGGIGVAIASLIKVRWLQIIVAVPFLLFGMVIGLSAGWDAAPERVRENLQGAISALPLVDSPAEQQAAADTAAATRAAAEERLAAQQAEAERLRLLQLEAVSSPCTWAEFAAFDNCFQVTLEAGDKPFEITKSDGANCFVRDDTRGTRVAKNGLTFNYYHDDSSGGGDVTFHVFEMTPEQSYRNANGTVRCPIT